MKKKKKYAIAQTGNAFRDTQARPDNLPKRPFLQDDTFAGSAYEDAHIEQQTSELGRAEAATPQMFERKFMNPNATEHSPLFKMLNTGIIGATDILGKINTAKADKNEYKQYLDALRPTEWENMERYGLDTRPVYTKAGGQVKSKYSYQTGGSQSAAPPEDEIFRNSATLLHYRDRLNQKLREKNPENYDNYITELAKRRRSGNMKEAYDYAQNADYNDYLTPDEVKNTLGPDYDTYLNSVQGVNNYNVQQGKQPLYGTQETGTDPRNLNYGRRFASLMMMPSKQVNNTRYNYQFNPKTKQVDVSTEDMTQEAASIAAVRQTGGDVMSEVEAEQGEAVQGFDGQILKITDDAPTHEQGGVHMNNVFRVLENTSTIRKDKASKYLAVDKTQAKALTGVDTSGMTSHADLLVKAQKQNEELRKKIVKNVELAGKDKSVLDKYAENSTKLNLEHFKAIPTEDQVFDMLFEHQEAVKRQVGIGDDGKMMKVGGSIRDYLDDRGVDGTYQNRKKLFGKYFDNYRGTAEQNTELLRRIKNGDITLEGGNSAPQPKAAAPRVAPPKNQTPSRASAINTPAKTTPNAPTKAAPARNAALESGVVVDKRANEAHVIKNGKVVKSFPVLTGQSPNADQNDYSMENLNKFRNLRGTPSGAYEMDPKANIYGAPGFYLDPIKFQNNEAPAAKSLAMHTTYDPAVRGKYYAQPAENRAQSYGCINCEKPNIEYLNKQFPQGDTLLVIDPKKGQTLKSLNINRQAGGKYDIAQAGVQAYPGSKNKGNRTPAGNYDAFPEGLRLDKYLEDLKAKGFNYEGIEDNKQLQRALYDKVLQDNPEKIKAMWQQGMHAQGMQKAKQLGFVDEKGNFKPGVLDNPENLKTLADVYPDGLLGIRTLALAQKPPRIWEDEAPPQGAPVVNPDPTFNPRINLRDNPQSQFNEPLQWYDVASPINAYLGASERLAEKYNPAEFNQLRYKLQDPTVALQQNQADFNSSIKAVQNTPGSNAGVQAANIANLASQKYAFNNQVLGNYENQNAQIKNQEILYNTQVRDKQSVSNQQSREVFEDKVLTSKAKQQEQQLVALDSLYKTIAENRALNRNGNLMMKFSTAFDQYGNWNGYTPQFQVSPQLGVTQTGQVPPIQLKGDAGRVQKLEPGKSYRNSKTGKTEYFDGVRLIPRS